MRCHLSFVATLAVSCAGPSRDASNVPPSCRVQLPPASAGTATATAPPPFVATRSTLVVGADVPLDAVQQAIEATVGRRLAEEHNQGIGIGGHLEYTIDRGAFSVRVQGDSLAVDAPLHAHVMACASGSCYAGCDPEAAVTAKAPLRLGPDFRFRPVTVEIQLTRGCQLSVLGGLVKIDLTPILMARLAGEKRRIEATIQKELPDVRPQAERLWGELSRPHSLPLGACVVLLPESITEGPASAGDGVAHLSFGLLARPEVRMRCGDPPPSTALPPLGDDPSLPAEGDLHLAVVLPGDATAPALEGAGTVIDLGAGRARIHRASGAAPALSVDLLGEACGSVAVGAAGAAWSDDGRAVHLAAVTATAGEADRMASVGLDAARLTKSIEGMPLGMPVATDQLATTLPALAAELSDERVTVAATVTDAKPEAAGLRGGEVVAVVRVRGAVTIRAKPGAWLR